MKFRLKIPDKIFSVKSAARNHKQVTVLGIKFKLKQKQESIFVPIGRSCHTAMLLDKMHLRKCSYPMDWIIPSSVNNELIETRINFILNNFENFFNYKDFIFADNPKTDNFDGFNLYNGFAFTHDFEKSKSPRKQYGKLKRKYNRRIKRLYKHMHNAGIVNLIYMQNTWDHLNETNTTLNDDLLKILQFRLKKRFPDITFKWHIFEHDGSLKRLEYVKKEISQDITKYISNHSFLNESHELSLITSIEKIFNEEILINSI